MNDYIINPSWFYWADVLDCIKSCLIIFGCVVFAVCLICMIELFVEGLTGWDKAYKKIHKAFIISCIAILVACFMPSKDTMYQMMIAKYITHENVTISIDAIKDAVDYITDHIVRLK